VLSTATSAAAVIVAYVAVKHPAELGASAPCMATWAAVMEVPSTKYVRRQTTAPLGPPAPTKMGVPFATAAKVPFWITSGAWADRKEAATQSSSKDFMRAFYRRRQVKLKGVAELYGVSVRFSGPQSDYAGRVFLHRPGRLSTDGTAPSARYGIRGRNCTPCTDPIEPNPLNASGGG
jgi:hypothetical protein